MATTHDEVLNDLLDAFPGEVFLVGRYADPALELGDGLRVFLPDLHWMSRSALQRFPGGYEFNGRSAKGGAPLFGTLLDLLETWRESDPTVEVYQLGDSFDLWREINEPHENAQSAYDRLRNDPRVRPLADRLVTLQTNFVRGNHDAWLKATTHGLPTLADEYSNGGSFTTHGHRYDTIERILPDEVRSFFVQLATTVKPRKLRTGAFRKTAIKRLASFLALRKRPGFPRDLYPTVEPEGALLIQRPEDVETFAGAWQFHLDVSVFSHGSGMRNDFEHIDYLSFGDDIWAHESNHAFDHTLYVIGHTHHARLLVDRTPLGKPLVIMDCGGWIEWCRVKTSPSAPAVAVPSAQVGVQQRNEVRIYQLGSGA
jgi:hypothetical protein